MDERSRVQRLVHPPECCYARPPQWRCYGGWRGRVAAVAELGSLDKMKIRAPQIAIIVIVGLFSASLLCSVLLNAWGYWQIFGIGGWRDQVYESEGAVASQQALHDFREGHLRLYCLGDENDRAKYT